MEVTSLALYSTSNAFRKKSKYKKNARNIGYLLKSEYQFN